MSPPQDRVAGGMKMKKILFILLAVLFIAGCASRTVKEEKAGIEKPANYEDRDFILMVLSPEKAVPLGLPLTIPVLLEPNETQDEGIERMLEGGFDWYHSYWGMVKLINETKDNQEFQESFVFSKEEQDELLAMFFDPEVEITPEMYDLFFPEYDEAVEKYKEFLIKYESAKS